MANIDSDVLMDDPDQGICACGFSLAYAAKRKTPARARRPRISRIGSQLLFARLVDIRISNLRCCLCRSLTLKLQTYWLSSESKNCFRIGHVTIPEDAGYF